jgi:hypothetical protein
MMDRRKYWDENYVKSLENQVQALLALQNNGSTATLPQDIPRPSDGVILDSALQLAPLGKSHQFQHAAPFNDADIDGTSLQSQTAMEELSVMMWRTNLADAVAIDEKRTINKPPPSQSSPQPAVPRQVPPELLIICGNETRLHELAALFLECINEEHQFTQYDSADFFLQPLDQSPDLLFLHAAMLAVGAAFENQIDSLKLSDELAELSESLVFKCFRQSPSIRVIQGLCILSWRSLALGRDHFGWTFLSMAAGMAVHLRLHVLALDDFNTESTHTGFAEVQTFWSFYMTDRTSISILGRNCVLPWRRVNVPAIESFFPSGSMSLAQVSFAWQCKLWYMHDQNMDQMYAPILITILHCFSTYQQPNSFSSSFESLATPQQVRLLITTHENLSQFFRSRDQRLSIKRGATEKPILLFHMAYQMAILVTMPPFLRLFAKMRNENPNTSHLMPVVLQSLTAAATAMVRLVQDYCKTYGFPKATPLLLHHLLSASIVHLMNTTTESFTLRRFSTRSVRKCLGLFGQLGLYWPARSHKSVELIKTLARRWNVEFALPEEIDSILKRNITGDVRFHGKEQTNQSASEQDTGLNTSSSGMTEENANCQFSTLSESENTCAFNDLFYSAEEQGIFTMNNSFLDHGYPAWLPMFEDFSSFRENPGQLHAGAMDPQ